MILTSDQGQAGRWAGPYLRKIERCYEIILDLIPKQKQQLGWKDVTTEQIRTYVKTGWK